MNSNSGWLLKGGSEALESQIPLEGGGGCSASREIGGNLLSFFMWKRGETRLKWMVPAGIFFPFGYG